MEVRDKVLIDRELLKELVSSLEGEVESRYSNGIKDHPAMRRDYECDIEPVIRGKELLAAAPAAPVAQAEQEPVAWMVRRWVPGENPSPWHVELKRPDRPSVEFRPLYAAPPAHPDAALVEALRNLLPDDDIRHLRRFQEICEDTDADGHDLPKEAVRRLERAGALRSCGFGRHETTLFGDAILAALAGKGGE